VAPIALGANLNNQEDGENDSAIPDFSSIDRISARAIRFK